MQLKEPYIKDSCYYSVIKLNSYTKILFIITYKNKKEEKLASLITKLVTSN